MDVSGFLGLLGCSGVLYLDKGVEQMRFGTAVKKIWHMEDSQGQILASAFKYISSKRFKLFPVRSEAEPKPHAGGERVLGRQLTGTNPLNRQDDFSGPALRNGSLNSLF